MTRIGQSVFLFGTVASAALLWFARTNRVPQAVDVARLLSRADQIKAVAYCTGTNAPVWPSNTVSSVPDWGTVYRKVLCASRDMMVMPGGIFWLDPTLAAFEDGDTLAYPNGQWYAWTVSTNDWANPAYGQLVETVYRVSIPSGSTDCYPVTSTRQPAPGVTNMLFIPDGVHYSSAQYGSDRYPLSPSNYPLGGIFYGVSSTGLTLEAYGSVWPRIGLGTNVYKLGCEFMSPERISVRKLGGDGFLALPGSLEFPIMHPAAGATLSVTNAFDRYDPGRVYAASAWELVSDDPTHYPVYFTVSAQSLAHPQAWQCSLGGAAGSAYGSGTTIPHSGTGTCSFTLLETGSTQYVFTVLGFGGIIPSSAYRITVNCAENSNPSASFTFLAVATGSYGGAGGFTVTWEGHPEYTLSQAFFIPPPGTVTNALSVSPQYNSPPMLFGEEKALSVGVPAQTNAVLRTNRLLKTGDLDQAASILTNLTRSMFVCGWSSLSGSCTNYRAFSPENMVTFRSEYSGSPDFESPSFSTMRDSAFGSLGPVSQDALAFDGLLASAELWVWRDCTAVGPGSPTPGMEYYVSEIAGYGYGSNQRRLTGCTLPYPSEYACTNGLVAKVTVFAVCTVSVDDDSSSAGYDLASEPWSAATTVNVDGHLTDFGDFSDFTFGIVSHTGALPEPFPSVGTEWTETSGHDLSLLGYGNETSIRLAKIAEFVDPAEVPAFDISTPAVWPDASTFPFHHVFWSIIGVPGYTPRVNDYSYGALEVKLYVTHFVVVVDWKWGAL